MEVNVAQLKPGMVVGRAVIGKSGKPIIPQHTVLTAKHITFIDKFLITTVDISRGNNVASHKTAREPQRFPKEKHNVLEEAVQIYIKMWNSWLGNIPIDMYAIRHHFTPIFEAIDQLSTQMIITLPFQYIKQDRLASEQVALSLLAIKLARKLQYERKDWLQIGFAALLCNAGLTQIKVNPSPLGTEELLKKQHPLHSYRLVEQITTLTPQAKVGILQHHEKLDGSGYPAGATADKIHVYARILGICDFFVKGNRQGQQEAILMLQQQKDTFDAYFVHQFLEIVNNIK